MRGYLPDGRSVDGLPPYLKRTTPEPFEMVWTSPLVATFNITMFFILVFMAGFFITASPCVQLHLFAARYHIRHPLFYVVAGGMFGLLALAAGGSLIDPTGRFARISLQTSCAHTANKRTRASYGHTSRPIPLGILEALLKNPRMHCVNHRRTRWQRGFHQPKLL
jgi:hypothetical protein